MKKWPKPMTGLFAAMLVASGLMAKAAEPFFFIQLSDPQFGMFTGNKDFAQETANFEFAVATVNRLRPKFVVITGDLVNKPGDAAQIAEFKRIAAKVDPAIQVYNVAGNHDVENVHLFSGHYHRNAVARDGDLEAVTTGPVGQPLGGDKSGLRVVIVRDSGLEHRYYHFGELPTHIDVAPAKAATQQAN